MTQSKGKQCSRARSKFKLFNIDLEHKIVDFSLVLVLFMF